MACPGSMATHPCRRIIDRFEQLLEGAIRRIPFLEQAQIITLVCHPGAYTPDCQPILGPMAGARGFWNACGMSLNGYGGAGGIGKLMAEWIVNGEPISDIYSFRATRFGNYYANPNYAIERTREVRQILLPPEIPARRERMGATLPHQPGAFPLQELGAVFGEKYGWERVNYFEPGKPWRMAGADQRKWGWTKPPFFERLRRSMKPPASVWRSST